MQVPMSFYTYVLECADKTYYTGWTTEPERRLAVHNQGRGAKYTRARLPVTMVACWCFASKSEAMKWEHFMKTLPRPHKEHLILHAMVRILEETDVEEMG